MKGPTERSARATWFAGLVVAAGAAVLTAHGATEVALGSGVPLAIGWLYPMITDGLALVAYAATTRLVAGGRAYAWSVVVLAAGLSGLAQASYLAGGGVDEAGRALRFGVGAWPAIAAAIAAHLLYLIGKTRDTTPAASVTPEQPARSSATGAELGAGEATGSPTPARDTGQRELRAGDRPALPQAGPAAAEPPVSRPGSQPVGPPAGLDAMTAGTAPRGGPVRRALAPIERARTTADLLHRRHGQWPTVRELAELAGVSRGTASAALQELRPSPDRLHLVADPTTPATPAGRGNESRRTP